MTKVVLKVEIYEDRIKQKAMKAVSSISGVESVSVDMKDKKLTLTGDIDPVCAVAKLKKFCHTEIVSVGPAKEEKKKEAKKDDNDKKETKETVIDPLKCCQTCAHYYCYCQMKLPQCNRYYCATFVEEDPNGCAIM